MSGMDENDHFAQTGSGTPTFRRKPQASSPWSYLRGLEPLSLCDWPGKSVCVLFFGGCNLRCPTCHNATLAWNMDALPPVSGEYMKQFLARRGKWLSGVVLTGGEPTCVPGIMELLDEISGFGLPVKVDTNAMLPKVMEAILRGLAIDHFAVDVKGPYALYPSLTGGVISPKQARDNLAYVFALAEARPEAFTFRTTLVPGLGEADIDMVRSMLPKGFSPTIQEYREPSADQPAGHCFRR